MRPAPGAVACPRPQARGLSPRRVGVAGARLTSKVAVFAATGLLVRLALAVLVRSHDFDRETYRSWARTLVEHPWSEFYARADGPDHLPGDVVLHGLLARGWVGAGGSLGSDAYSVALKAVPSLADAAIAVLVAVLASPRIGPERAARWGLLAWCCPVLWLVSAWWGQWDSVGVAVLLGGVTVLARRPRAWPTGIALLAWACLIKPQLALAAGPAVVALHIGRGPGVLGRWVRVVVVGLGTVQLVCGPFTVGLVEVGARWSLIERIGYAANRFHAMTLGAPNLWAFTSAPGGPDSMAVGPLTAGTAGVVLLGAGLAGVILRWWHVWRTDPLAGALWWGAVNLALFYAVMTRCHERYLVPACVLALALAAIEPRCRRGAVVLSTVLVATLLHSLVHLGSGPHEATFFRVLALILAAGLVDLLSMRPLGRSAPSENSTSCERDPAQG